MNLTFMRIGWLVAFTFGLAASAGASDVAPAQRMAQRTFPSPEQAVEAFVAAHRSSDARALVHILGPDGDKLIHSGDPVADARSRTRIVSAYDESHRIERQGTDKAILVIGKEEWPLPIPLVRSVRTWRFDTAAGEQEILNRRVGRDELQIIQTCRAYVQAQREYASSTKPAHGSLEYAQHIMSHEGRHDGLYWPASAGEVESPLGPLVAQARAQGYAPEPAGGPAEPYHGYFLHILTRQGSHAPGGERNYLVDGHMTRGFALLAYPARYGDSGVMTFVVNQDGIVFEKNLGLDTAILARRIDTFDPDPSWHTAP